MKGEFMGISDTQYRDIMFEYDQLRMKNQRILDDRYKSLYEEIPELKEIHDSIIEASLAQAKEEILNPQNSATSHISYTQNKDRLLKRKAALLKQYNYPEDYLNPIYTCTKCKDTGMTGNSPCTCFKQAKLKTLYKNSNLDHVLQLENFSTFSTEYYDDTTIHDNLSLTPRENIIRVREACESFIKHFDTAYENMIFYGQTGVGKTFLTHCIAKELLDSSHTVVYLTSLQLFDILEKNKFHKEDPASTNEQIAYILNSDLFIIDDLGTELSNAFTASQLYYFIEERHINKRSTIISTNLSFSDIRERYSERILSRFIGYYDFKQIVGNDIRTQKALKNK